MSCSLDAGSALSNAASGKKTRKFRRETHFSYSISNPILRGLLGSGGNEGADLLPADNADDIARLAHAEDHHRHVVVFAQGNSRGVHHTQVETKDLAIRDLGEFGRFIVDFGVSGINSVDGSSFEEDVGFDLHRPQAGGRVCGEEWIPGSSSKDDDAALFKVAHRAAADIGLRDFVHLNGGHHTTVKPKLFDSVLERNSVDHGREHAHVIGCHTVHVDCLLGDSAKEVATSHDDGDLTAKSMNGGYLCSDFVNKDGIDAEALARGQSFS